MLAGIRTRVSRKVLATKWCVGTPCARFSARSLVPMNSPAGQCEADVDL